jgi:hypothetical protein
VTKRQLAAAKKKALAQFKHIYPECVDFYIRTAFVVGWLEALASKRKEAT